MPERSGNKFWSVNKKLEHVFFWLSTERNKVHFILLGYYIELYITYKKIVIFYIFKKE